MGDMLANLSTLTDSTDYKKLAENGITIKRAMASDKTAILAFAKDNFGMNWADEAEHAFCNSPISCYIAVKDKEVWGFSCYDATAKGFFGPVGVKKAEHGGGVGKALLIKALMAMYEQGYGYAIIGWTDEASGFYQKSVNAIPIPDSEPTQSIYSNLIMF